MNIKHFIVFALAAVAIAANADVQILRRGARRPGRERIANDGWVRVSYRHVPLSDPADPFHDTYKRNTGRLNDEAPKPLRNARAKANAAEKQARKAAQEAENRSPISVYSNYGSLTADSGRKASDAESAPRETAQKVINIYDSTVIINN